MSDDMHPDDKAALDNLRRRFLTLTFARDVVVDAALEQEAADTVAAFEGTMEAQQVLCAAIEKTNIAARNLRELREKPNGQ